MLSELRVYVVYSGKPKGQGHVPPVSGLTGRTRRTEAKPVGLDRSTDSCQAERPATRWLTWKAGSD